MAERTLVWVGSSLEDIRRFPDDARRLAGHELHLVQQGMTPSDWKVLPSVGPGVYEIRIHTRVEHRVLYLARFTQHVYVLHAFQKKTRKTLDRDIGLARARLREVMAHRRGGR